MVAQATGNTLPIGLAASGSNCPSDMPSRVNRHSHVCRGETATQVYFARRC